MKLAWMVYTVEKNEDGHDRTTNSGYGESPELALKDLLSKLEIQSETIMKRAQEETAGLIRVRGEIEALANA